MEKEKGGKILKAIGLTLEIIGPTMAIHHRISYGRWCDDKHSCHGRVGLVLTGIGVPLSIAGSELSKRGRIN